MTGKSPRVVVGVSGTLANLAALHIAVARAQLWQRRLLAVAVWTPVPESEKCRAREDRAAQVLVEAFTDGFGAMPSDVDVDLRVVDGLPGEVLVNLARAPGDLLVIGESRGGLLAFGQRSTSRYCRRHAQQLIVVPRPPLLEELGQLQHIRDIAGLMAI